MKHKRILALLAAILLALTACSSSPEARQPTSTLAVSQEIPPPANNSSPESSEPNPAHSRKPAERFSSTLEKEHVLIAYFTWAENTHVDDPDSVDVDATTSASVLLPGNAAKLAGWIRQEVGGDLFSMRGGGALFQRL